MVVKAVAMVDSMGSGKTPSTKYPIDSDGCARFKNRLFERLQPELKEFVVEAVNANAKIWKEDWAEGG